MYQNIITAPVISEKSMSEASAGKFTFRVAKNADKKQIKKEIEKRYKVNVVKVFTNIVKGKKRRYGTKRTEVLSSSWKKAKVKLKPGQKIDVFDVAAQKG
ncbi:MAG: 50S ribosomal protein L23 [Candidatus Levybacteria bacterium]|nr:50S ribosomal protein L23 [Candidatus Levybacteria bacterium]